MLAVLTLSRAAKAGVVVVSIVAALLPAETRSQAYPAKPIRILVSLPAGVSGDTAIRMAAPAMGASLGQPIVVENNPAAAGRVAVLAVKKAPPDGYSLLLASSGQLVAPVYLVKDLPYNPVRDFAPISTVVRSAVLFTVSASLPVNSVPEFIEYAKRNPGKIAYGSAGTGSALHLIGEALVLDAEIKMLHVPYNTANVALPLGDLAGDRIQLYFASYISLLPALAGGKVRAIAVMDKARLRPLPDVPTIFETLPNSTLFPSWFALFAPSGTPGPILQRLQGELRGALLEPVVRNKIEDLGTTPVGGTPDELAEEVRNSLQAVGRLTKALNIEPQ